MNDRVILPTPPPILNNQQQEIHELFQRFVVPSYGRFNLALSHGAGSHVWDVSGKRYLDLGGGIAVCSLGHAHPEITEALVEQSRRLVHVSNLYYQGPTRRFCLKARWPLFCTPASFLRVTVGRNGSPKRPSRF